VPGLRRPSRKSPAHRTEYTRLPGEEDVPLPAPGAEVFDLVSDLKLHLAATYPDSFAGVYFAPAYEADDKPPSLHIAFAEKAPVTEDDITDWYRKYTPNFDAIPQVSVDQVDYSLHQLNDLATTINQDLSTLDSADIGPSIAYVSEIRNRVTVTINAEPSERDARLLGRYPAQMIEVSHMVVHAMGRTNDSAPWNGANKMVGPNYGVSSQICTVGFGAHIDVSGGSRFLLSAGHCGDRDWYNTDTVTGDFSYARWLGHSAAVYTPIQSGRDNQKILAYSSRLFWKGANGAETRQYVASSAWSAEGTLVCHEGAMSGEQCGVVTASNLPAYIFADEQSGWLTNGIKIVNCPAQDGDSGAPVVWPTAVGYVGVGILVGAGFELIGGQSVPVCVAQEIKSVEAQQGVVLNSLINPP
jgi:hypothetical protein